MNSFLVHYTANEINVLVFAWVQFFSKIIADKNMKLGKVSPAKETHYTVLCRSQVLKSSLLLFKQGGILAPTYM